MRRDLILLSGSLILWGIGEGLFFYFQPLYLEQLGADPLLIGLILGAYGVAMTVTHIPAGYLADRLGRKPMLLAAWGIGTIAAWIMALASDLSGFVVGMLLYGATLFVLAPLNSYVTAARGRLSAGRAITLVSASFNIGVIAGPWLGGRIGDQVGLRQTYWIAAVLFVISTAILLLVRAQPVERPEQQQTLTGLRGNRPYQAFLAVVFLTMLAMVLPQALAPNYLQNQHALSLERIGWLYTVSGVGIVSLNLILGQLSARIGFILCQVAVAGFALLMWWGNGLPWFALGYFLLGGHKVARSLASAQVREMVTPAEMGLAFGITETVGGAAAVLAPPLAGVLYGWIPAGIFFISAVGMVIAILATVAVRQRWLVHSAVQTIGQVRSPGD